MQSTANVAPKGTSVVDTLLLKEDSALSLKSLCVATHSKNPCGDTVCGMVLGNPLLSNWLTMCTRW